MHNKLIYIQWSKMKFNAKIPPTISYWTKFFFSNFNVGNFWIGRTPCVAKTRKRGQELRCWWCAQRQTATEQGHKLTYLWSASAFFRFRKFLIWMGLKSVIDWENRACNLSRCFPHGPSQLSIPGTSTPASLVSFPMFLWYFRSRFGSKSSFVNTSSSSVSSLVSEDAWSTLVTRSRCAMCSGKAGGLVF